SNMIASFLGEDDTTRQQPGNLFEHNDAGIALHRDDVLLVCGRRDSAHGVTELALLVEHVGNNPRHGRTIHVNIEHVKKDADPRARGALLVDYRDIRYLPVSRRDDGPRNSRNGTFGIPEEPQEERS